MRLVAAAAAIGLSLFVGTGIAGATSWPSCPPAPSGYFLDPGAPSQSGFDGSIPWFDCHFTSTDQKNGFFTVRLYWAQSGSTDTTAVGCTIPSNSWDVLPSTSYWGHVDVGGFPPGYTRQDPSVLAAIATAKAWLPALAGRARPCSSTSGSGGTTPPSVRKECPQKKPVIKESQPVPERLTFAASHKGTPALTVNGAANLKSFYCFYKDGDHDRVGSALGSGAIVQTAPHAVSIGFTLTGFPKSAVKGGTITDTVTGRVTTVSATSTCKVGATIAITIVKTRTASRVSFAIGGGCGSYSFGAADSSVTLQ